jgi:hypothetical protein
VWLAFPVAVRKKFGDDQAGNPAALVAYYAFVALFPLLVALVVSLVLNIGFFWLAFLYLEAELTLYAVEINVVREYRLWPRSIAPPPYTKQDQRAFELYAAVQKGEDILVKVEGEDDREKTSG